MIKLTKTIREDLILIIGENAVDLFDYFQVEELHGLSKEKCFNRIDEGGTYIDGMCNIIPGTENSPAYYLFINHKAISKSSVRNFGLIFHETSHYSFIKYWETLQEDEENLITESEDLAIEIYNLIF